MYRILYIHYTHLNTPGVEKTNRLISLSCFRDRISLVEWDPLIKLADDGLLRSRHSCDGNADIWLREIW